jgi:arsenate reductase (thioredoxin)
MTDPSPLSDPELVGRLERVAASLARELAGIFSLETTGRYVTESAERLAAGARIVEFLPLLTYRFARQRLRALAQAEGMIVKDVPEVLFVCPERWTVADGRWAVASSCPGRGSCALRRVGARQPDSRHRRRCHGRDRVDISREVPKPMTDDEVVRAADVVITMGCGDACPVYPGKRYLDWDVPDPAGRSGEEVVAIRDEIDRRVRALLAELFPTAH